MMFLSLLVQYHIDTVNARKSDGDYFLRCIFFCIYMKRPLIYGPQVGLRPSFLRRLGSGSCRLGGGLGRTNGDLVDVPYDMCDECVVGGRTSMNSLSVALLSSSARPTKDVSAAAAAKANGGDRTVCSSGAGARFLSLTNPSPSKIT